jgi:glycosyltransferase involved in cell wall biosynthesis
MNENKKPLLIHLATVALSFFYASQLGQFRFMKKRGFELMVAASPDDKLDQFAKMAGIDALGVHIERNSITPLRDMRALWEAWRLFRRLKPNIVHAHSPKGGLIGMTAAFLAGVDVRLYHMHGLIHLSAAGLQGKFMYLCERLSCALAHRIYFVSSSNLMVALEEKLCGPPKAKVLSNGSINGVDAAIKFNPEKHDRAAIRTRLNIPREALVVGFVGRVINGKGLRELMAAWGNLRERFANLYLVIVGPMEEKDAIAPDLKNRILEDCRVRYVGEVADTSPFYAVMDVLAFPTYREGFGLVAIEASAMQVPVVATNVSGVTDAVIDGQTGILIPPADSFALEQAIELYLSHSELRYDHGHNGRKRVMALFKPEDIWEEQYKDYMALLQHKKKKFTEPAGDPGK